MTYCCFIIILSYISLNKDEIVYDQTLIINPHNLSNFGVSALDQVGASFL